MPMTDFLQDKVLNAVLKGTDLDITLANVTYSWAGLHSTICSEDAAGTELNDTNDAGYERCPAQFDSSVDGVITTSASLVFQPNVGANAWSTAVSIGFYDAQTGGNLLLYSNSISPRTLSGGDTLTYSPGDVSVTLT